MNTFKFYLKIHAYEREGKLGLHHRNGQWRGELVCIPVTSWCGKYENRNWVCNEEIVAINFAQLIRVHGKWIVFRE